MTPESTRNPRRSQDLSQDPSAQPLDFLGAPEAVRVLVEGERLSYGHLFNPAFATEIDRKSVV